MGSCHIQVDTTSPFNKRIGLVLMSPEKVVIEKSLRLDLSATNNEVEYETLLEGCWGPFVEAQWMEKPNDEGHKELTV